MLNIQDSHHAITCTMIASNSNTLLKGADYSETFSCLAYAAANLIHLYDPKLVKTHLTLKGHKTRVNLVKWIDRHKYGNDLIELLSCSADGVVIHWVNLGKEKNPFEYKNWKIEKTYHCSDKSQQVSINCLESLFISSLEKYFAIFSSSGILDLFYFDIDLNEYKMFHSIPFKKKLQDTVCMSVLNETYLMLITGGYDFMINVYTVMRIKLIQSKLSSMSEFTPCSYKVSIQGHVNAIRDISVLPPLSDQPDDFYFASASQDTYIRIWHVVHLQSSEIKSIAEAINTKGSLSIFDEYKSKTSYVIKTEEDDYFNIILDSVLAGHEESVSSINWGYFNTCPVLLSSSFDFTVGVWKYDDKYNMWNKDVTLGEMEGNKHAFFYATFIENYQAILAYSYNGSFYLWRYNDEDKQYKSMPVIHGHFGPVSDLDWDPTRNLLFTCSEDQTCRVFAKWKKNNTWHEIGRPQIHGYDMNTICCLNENLTKEENYICKIVSGSDEKILRIFTPPFNIIKFLQELPEVDLKFSHENDNIYYEKYYHNIEGSKQALGLMTKQVKIEAQDDEEENYDFSNFNPDAVLTNKSVPVYSSKDNYHLPPDENLIANNTLWPEVTKLYGHGYEIISISTSHDSHFIASGGKSQAEKNSKLFIWDAHKGKLLTKLGGHALTIVQSEFSPSDEYILTVSRDRAWCLYKRSSESYVLFHQEKEAHARIIWGCSWSSDSQYFATVSRDKVIKIWQKDSQSEKFILDSQLEIHDAITAVNFIPGKFKKDCYYLILIGLENGEVAFYSLDPSTHKIALVLPIHQYLTHGASVRRIKSYIDNLSNHVCFATGSDDHSVRLFEIDITILNNLA